MISVIFIASAVFIVMLSGCSSTVSGRFVGVDNASINLIFDGNTASLYEDGTQIWSGSFRESARTAANMYLLTIEIGNGNTSSVVRFWLDQDKETIFYAVMEGATANVGDIAFLKED